MSLQAGSRFDENSHEHYCRNYRFTAVPALGGPCGIDLHTCAHGAVATMTCLDLWNCLAYRTCTQSSQKQITCRRAPARYNPHNARPLKNCTCRASRSPEYAKPVHVWPMTIHRDENSWACSLPSTCSTLAPATDTYEIAAEWYSNVLTANC